MRKNNFLLDYKNDGRLQLFDFIFVFIKGAIR